MGKSPKGRAHRCAADLAAMSGEHLRYEFAMFFALASLLEKNSFANGVIKNAALEAFTVHARILLDFFFAANPREDDVVAADFVQNWPMIRPPISPALNQVNQRVGKEIAHLTYARLVVTPKDKLWPYKKIVSDMSDLLTVFNANVPPGYLGSAWKKDPRRF